MSASSWPKPTRSAQSLDGIFENQNDHRYGARVRSWSTSPTTASTIPDRWGVPTYRFDGARLVECGEEDGDRCPCARWQPPTSSRWESGTGIVHIAPAFGEDDYLLGREVGLLFRQPVDLSGRIVGDSTAEAAPSFVGKWVKDADPMIMDDLESRGLLLRKDVYEHTYPYCWRCDTPLLYYAKPSWYIATSQAKDLPDQFQRRADPLAPGTHGHGALWRLAGQQRRLGRQPRALLGHAVAVLALHRMRRRLLRRLLRRTARARTRVQRRRARPLRSASALR